MNSHLEWQEKREYERLATDADIWARNRVTSGTEDAALGLGTRCQLIDLSFSGAKLIAAIPLGAKGDVIALTLPTAGENMLPLSGTIVRTETYDKAHITAVRFARIPAADHLFLSEVLKSLSANSSLLIRSRPLSPASRSTTRDSDTAS